MNTKSKIVALTLVGIGWYACDSSAPYPYATSPYCVDRMERYPPDKPFPFDDQGPPGLFPACAPTCGAGLGAENVLDEAALPAGACDPSVVTCEISAYVPCHGCPDYGPVNDYRCSCENAHWSCVMIAQGPESCACEPPPPPPGPPPFR